MNARDFLPTQRMSDQAWCEQVAALSAGELDELHPLIMAAAYSLIDKARFVHDQRRAAKVPPAEATGA